MDLALAREFFQVLEFDNWSLATFALYAVGLFAAYRSEDGALWGVVMALPMSLWLFLATPIAALNLVIDLINGTLTWPPEQGYMADFYLSLIVSAALTAFHIGMANIASVVHSLWHVGRVRR